MANTTHPIACILLHATPVGSGVHLFSTSLAQGNADPGAPVLWNAAQSPFADRSHALTDGLRTAFGRSRIPVSAGQTWMRPLDNMQCPAVAVEISPEPDGGPAADDAGYQSRVASVIAGAMIFWRGKYAAMTPQPTPPPAPAVQPAAAVQPAPASQPVATPPASRLAP
jgi:N-acetylmuramoyl-L-alanine amidase